MPNNLKALLVILVLAGAAFALARPVMLQFCAAGDFRRRRNVWCLLTIVAFISPSFWLFTALAAPLLVWAGRRDSNPVALYLFVLQVIPPTSVKIPVIGIHELFSLDIYRLLALCVLAPEAWRQWSSRRYSAARWGWMDGLLVAYGLLNVLLFVRPDLPDAAALHDSITNVMRRATLFFLDVYLLYFVVSRSCSSRAKITDAMASFCLMCVVMASIAVFESARHWLLYAEMGKTWGAVTTNYLLRAGVVRATASAGNSLALGYLLAIALGFWLYLRGMINSPMHRIGAGAVLLLGLIAAFARGPWAGALLIVLGFAVLGPRAAPRLLRVALVTTVILAFVMASPLGSRIAAVIPFLGGHVGAYNISYRERLLHRSLDIIGRHPWLGDQNAYSQLQDLRQGVGVIDFVNTYADIAVFYGMIGLSLFVGFMLAALARVRHFARAHAGSDPAAAMLAASIAACILGTLLMIYTSSFIFGYAQMYYVLAGLAAGCTAGLRQRRRITSPAAPAAHALAAPVMMSRARARNPFRHAASRDGE